MNAADRELFQKWAAKAEEDLQAAANLLHAEPLLPAVVCFHCQQAAEKYLKALLVLHGQAAPKIHDLESLVTAAIERGSRLAGILNSAKHLTDYAVDSRYPDAPFEFTVELARQAEQHALAIKRTVLHEAGLLLGQAD